MKKIYIISSLIVLIGIASGISYFLVRDANAQIPEGITLLTMDEEKYTFGEDTDTIKLVEFIYTNCPDICPTTTQEMNLLRNDLIKENVYGDKVQFLTITIDPYRDSPEVLRKYMENFGLENDGNWIFLTGDPANTLEEQQKIKKVADTFKFQYRDPGNGFYVHSTFTYLIDENNKFIKKFPMGEDFKKDKVFEAIMDEL
ncbi:MULTISPECIES: SCO family protein [Bacillaceae]|jgi:protein SCO1|uniref:SCO family protein n=1 Tax=Bacillaceae TaxID=186817 RepID=UPI00119E8784|nr:MULTISPECIES: SCO family protein [Bacillaceae]MCM3121961.1 SCO family protein [Mesobacillus sp. MER 33]MCM3231925.1 SCO family protein [Mesobacillus sp. MER 48]